MPLRRVQILPNLITLGNAFCGLLALAKAIDALTLSSGPDGDPVVFYQKMETACQLVFLGMVFDSLDGMVARLTRGASDFGAQLDSFADALTFGVVPAMLAKVLIEHEGLVETLSGTVAQPSGNPRLHFLAAAVFSLMAILRLVRFNLEPPPPPERRRGPKGFRGLPSPAAAGTVAATIWLYLILRRPELEQVDGSPTPMHRMLDWMNDLEWGPILDFVPPFLVALLPVLGLLMVSNVPYPHVVSQMLSGRTHFFALVGLVFALVFLFLAPVPLLFLSFLGFTVFGVARALVKRFRERGTERRPA